MEDSFRFKQFSVRNRDSALKVGTDAVLLGAAMTINPQGKSALDIGTGTGVIALMAAQRSNYSSITAIEIDAPSASEAKYNFSESPWSERLSIINADLNDYRPAETFDHIFSNPPYFIDSLLNPDQREATARHTCSLSAADICRFAQNNLSEEGHLSLILPSEDEKTICRTASSFGLSLFRILRIRTTGRKPVRRIVVEFKRNRSAVRQEELTLQTGSMRTPEYQALTQDFYL